MKKNIWISALFIATLVSCTKKTETPENQVAIDVQNMEVFGEPFDPNQVKTQQEMAVLYANLKEGDTITTQFVSEIEATCKKKGCWMSLDLGNDEQAIVRFTDYGFFVPKEGAVGKEAVVNGKAFLAITSVDQLKHDAKDAGKSQTAIDSITAPKVLKMFIADGVLIQK
ncbi:DUF4920 domain-containing protein [Flavobacterium agricola]|uniref:DUF4920 domain-containing protein n=1 Tax=Flavobacterium agricola TaxID=2870839 RepID=A0ABY6M0S3_9FLAO|nr:DUF4920 domain-containing protein [Flavobacterium agricola]UYW02152.1 DUF4920 domain-containing protein [Flavobacterium agricola]